jgi:hypothetical protein
MIRVRGFAVGLIFGVLATWMVAGLLSSASGTSGEQPVAPAHTPNGDPCAGQELTLKIDGKEGSPVIPYGPATIKGVLHCGTVPIRHAQVQVASGACLPAGVARINGTATTGLDGSFAYIVPAGPNRVLSFSYMSYSDDPGASVTATAALRVRPQMSLAITPTVVRKHHPIFWTVTVHGAPFPSRGTALAVQVKEGRKWKTFDEVLLHREGKTRIYEYRFLRTVTPTTYTFRLALPAKGSGNYPFSFGASNAVNVHVNP